MVSWTIMTSMLSFRLRTKYSVEVVILWLFLFLMFLIWNIIRFLDNVLRELLLTDCKLHLYLFLPTNWLWDGLQTLMEGWLATVDGGLGWGANEGPGFAEGKLWKFVLVCFDYFLLILDSFTSESLSALSLETYDEYTTSGSLSYAFNRDGVFLLIIGHIQCFNSIWHLFFLPICFIPAFLCFKWFWG